MWCQFDVTTYIIVTIRIYLFYQMNSFPDTYNSNVVKVKSLVHICNDPSRAQACLNDFSLSWTLDRELDEPLGCRLKIRRKYGTSDLTLARKRCILGKVLIQFLQEVIELGKVRVFINKHKFPGCRRHHHKCCCATLDSNLVV